MATYLTELIPKVCLFTFLSYLQPGLRSILSQPFPKPGLTNYANSINRFFQSFVQDDRILTFAAHFCNTSREKLGEMSDFCMRLLYRCLTEEKPEIIATYLSIYQTAVVPQQLFSCRGLANTRLLLDFARRREHSAVENSLLVQLESYIESFLDTTANEELLREYAQTLKFPQHLSSHQRLQFGGYLIFYDLPSCGLLTSELTSPLLKNHPNPLVLLAHRNPELLDISLLKMVVLLR